MSVFGPVFRPVFDPVFRNIFDLYGDSAGGVTPSPSPPVNAVLPEISGIPSPGFTLTCSTGAWAGWPRPTYTYQWKKDDAEIVGETGNTYLVIAGDIGAKISCEVTATNSEGSATAAAAAVTIVEADTAPYNTQAPVVTGDTLFGSELTTTDGIWGGSVPMTFAYQWKADGVNIVGANAVTYTTLEGQVGQTITCEVKATNSFGSGVATSNGILVDASTETPNPDLDLNFLTATIAPTGAPDADGGTTALDWTSRASHATMYNKDGNLVYAAYRDGGTWYEDQPATLPTPTADLYGARIGYEPVTNMVRYPEQFDVDPWVPEQATVSPGHDDPLGGTNACKLAETSGTVTPRIKPDNGTAYLKGSGTETQSFYVKAAERRYFSLRPFGVGSNRHYIRGDAETGTITYTGGSNYLSSAVSPVEGAEGWYRFSVTYTDNGIGPGDWSLYLDDQDRDEELPSYTGDGSSGLYMFGAMVNEGGIKDYVGSTTFVDRDVAGAGSGVVDIPNDDYAPDGTLTASLIGDGGVATNVSAVWRQGGSGGPSFPAYGFYRAEQYVRPVAGSSGWIVWRRNNLQGNSNISFDVNNQAIGTVQGGWTNASITPAANGYFLLSAIFELTSDLSGNLNSFLGAADNSLNSDGNSSYHFGGSWISQVGTANSHGYPAPFSPQTGFTQAGYIAEPAQTYLLPNSNDPDDTGAASVGVTVIGADTTGPSGAQDFMKLEITDTTNEHHRWRPDWGNIGTIDQVLHASMFVKKGGWRYPAIQINGNVNVYCTVVFDAVTGEVTKAEALNNNTLIDQGVEDHGDFWRVWAKASTQRADNLSVSIQAMLMSGPTPTLDGSTLREAWSATPGTYIHVGYFNVTISDILVSYFPTSGGAATRQSDSTLLKGYDIDFLGTANEAEGTWLIDHTWEPRSGNTWHFATDHSSLTSDYFNFHHASTVTYRVANSSAAGGQQFIANFNKGGAEFPHEIWASTVSLTDNEWALNGELRPVSVSDLTDTAKMEFFQYTAAVPQTYRKTQYWTGKLAGGNLEEVSSDFGDGTAWRDSK